MSHHRICDRLGREDLLFGKIFIPGGREVRAREGRVYGGGVDGITAGIAVGEFHREAFVEGEDCGFGGAVVDEAGGDNIGGERGDGYDVAFAGFEHFGEDLTRLLALKEWDLGLEWGKGGDLHF